MVQLGEDGEVRVMIEVYHLVNVMVRPRNQVRTIFLMLKTHRRACRTVHLENNVFFPKVTPVSEDAKFPTFKLWCLIG